MNLLLTKARLNTLRQRIYGSNVQAAFFKVTPTLGETAIGTITDGFYFQRERRAGQEIDGSGVTFWLSSSAAINRSQLTLGGVVALTVDGITFRYKIATLLPMQQIGSGYTMRLSPLRGATS